MNTGVDTERNVQVLWRQFSESRDPSVRRHLIEHYMPLARMIAARIYGSIPIQPASFDDYLQYARVGLIEAVDRFDVGRRVAFETYSAHRIRGAILNGIGHESEAAAQRDFWRTRASDRIESLLGERARHPERASLHELIDLTVGIALGLMLDDDRHEPADESLQSNPYAMTEIEQFVRLIRPLVDRLPDREREIVRSHYFDRHEFQAIAQRYGLTKGRISQMHGAALRRLREMLGEQTRLDRKV